MMRMFGKALAVCGALLCGACQSDSTTPSAVADASQLPADQVIYGLHHTMTNKGVRTAILDADTAYLREEGERFDLVGVELQFFREGGAPSGTLTSETGEYEAATGEFVAYGDVVLVTSGPKGPRTLRTEELHFSSRADEIWSDHPFVLEEGGRTTRGSNFRSDLRFEQWTVTNAETAGGLPESQEGVTF